MKFTGDWKRPIGRNRPYRPALFLLGLAALSMPGSLPASAQGTHDPAHGSARFTLHSTEPYQAVHVPFTLQDGDILFQATLAGKSVECSLDTGDVALEWNAKLALPGRLTGRVGFGIDGAGQKRSGVFEVCLPAIHIGGYELDDVDGLPISTGAAMEYLEHTALIGAPAFTPVVLTIDYQKKELILRQPAYDFSRQPRGAHDLVFDLAPKILRDKGMAVLQATMGGKPVRMLLDTGWDGPAIGLTTTFRDKIRPFLNKENTAKSEKVSRNMLGGEVELEQIPQVSFSLGDKQPILLKRPAVVIPKLSFDVDAVLGPDVLQYFRVTIDYPRHKLLLEPYLPDIADYINPDSSRVHVIIGETSYWIPNGSVVTANADGSVEIAPQKAQPGS